MSHTGIRLRVRIPAGVILEGDSDWLHLTAKLANASKVPDTAEALLATSPLPEPWHQFLGTTDGLEIWVQPCILADEYPDDEGEPETCESYFMEATVDCDLPAGHDGMHHGELDW